MHDERTMLEARVVKERARLVAGVYRRSAPVEVAALDVAGEPIPFEEAVEQCFTPFKIGDHWGTRWGTTWFRLVTRVPASWSGPVELAIDLGFDPRSTGFQCEGLVYRTDGQPLQGVHPNRTGIPLDDAGPGETIELYVEAASNPATRDLIPSTMGASTSSGPSLLYRFVRAELAERDDEVIALVHDLDVLDGVMRSLPPSDPRRRRLVQVLTTALDSLDLLDVASSAASTRAVLAPALELPARASAQHVVAVGHAHIDTAWLWPMRETVRKCTRTFSSVVRLMDAMPDHRFVCSQAAQYAWIEQRFPELFGRIGEKVAAGQWIPAGGMWVEADMNLPSGESIVRQLVHGQRAFEQWFGRRCEEVWLPDVFGYPASLPQIFAQAGCRRFVTQKLSWNEQNSMPHHTFWWEGIDGTRVLTHFPPVDTYNAEMQPTEIARAEANFREAGWSDWSLMPYGYGDGGGGPTREMVERGRRLADLDGSPRVHLGSVDEFFEAVEAEIAAGAPVPTWVGELYLEMHRGTYTSQIGTKLANRRCERLLREAELWLAHAGAEHTTLAMLDGAWKEVLLHQFHDILPGSSIRWVHQEAELALGRVAERLEELTAGALRSLSPGGGAVANARTHAADEVVLTGVPPPAGVVAQELAGGGRWAYRVRAAGLSLAPFADACGAGPAAHAVERGVTATTNRLTNEHLDVALDGDGRLRSVRDVLHDRQLLRAGAVGSLMYGPDLPVDFEAWDLESWARRLAVPVLATDAVEVVDPGPLTGAVRVVQSFGSSTASLTYRLRSGSPRLDIEIEVDWRDSEQILTLDLPIDVRAERATCGIQFGHVQRPTHASTSWDAAKFEVCAHRWVDLAEPSFGVAVLTDGRYGHDLRGGGVRVTLLRSAIWPDTEADLGHHRATVALMAHGAGLHDVVREAEALDLPLRIIPDGAATSAPFSLVTVDHPGVLVSAVKAADDGSGDVIVRLHEAHGDRAVVPVRGDFVEARDAALTEEPGEAHDVAGGLATIRLRPFELRTLRLVRRRA